MKEAHKNFTTEKRDVENYIHFHDRTHSMDVSLIQSGYQIPHYRQRLTPTIPDHYIFHFVRTGNGLFHLKDRTYEIGESSCFLMYPDQPAFYLTEKDQKWEYYWLGLAGSDMEFLLKEIGFSRERQVIIFHDSQIFTYLSNILSSALLHRNDPLGISLHTIPLVSSLLFILLKERRTGALTFPSYIIQDNSHIMAEGTFGNKYVKQVTKYIEEHYQEQITVEDIAKALHLNRSYLSTLYKVNSQKSIKQYLQHHRILRSTMLLQRTNLSIAEIAMEVGFKDPLYFSRIFKAHMRCSPTQYRAQYQ